MSEFMPYPGLGLVFNIDALEEEYEKRTRKMHQVPDVQKLLEGNLYGRAAWRTFMKLVQPPDITPSLLFEGDTALTLRGYQNEYCIAVYGPKLNLEALRQKFLEASDYGLAPFHRRLIEKIALDRQPLVIFGEIDPFGTLVTETWTRREHNLCKEAGWPYAPEQVPTDLDPQLAAELAEMRRQHLE